MTTTTRTIQRAAVALVSVALISSACSDERIVSPIFGEGCDVGTLRIGASVTSALHEDSPCIDTRNFYSGYRTPYEAYEVRLEAGKAYMFRQERIPDPTREGRNDLDALLSIWGRSESGASVPLGMSDQEGGGDDAELHFIAPKTGTYRLVAGSYYGLQQGDFGGYRLTSAECPVLGRITGSGDEEFNLKPSACLRHEAGFTGGWEDDPIAAYRYIRIDAKPNEQITIRVESDDFVPAWEVFGPGIDTYGYLYADSWSERRNGNGQVVVTTGAVGGTVTLAIGVLETTGPDEEFEVTVTRAPAGPLTIQPVIQTPKPIVPRR